MATTVEAMLRAIDEATARPMSQEEALDYLQHLRDELEPRIEALKEEIGS